MVAAELRTPLVTLSLGGEVQLASYLYAVPNRSGNWATVGIDLDHPLYGLAVLLVSGKVEGLLDPLNNQHLALGLYLPDGICVEALAIKGNLARRQRAGKGAEQSPTGSSDQVVERAWIGIFHVRGDAVVLGHLAMDPKVDWLFFGWQLCPPDLSFHWLYLHP